MGRGVVREKCQHREIETNRERMWSTVSNDQMAIESLNVKKLMVIFERAGSLYLGRQNPDGKSRWVNGSRSGGNK